MVVVFVVCTIELQREVKTEVKNMNLYPCDPHAISNLPLGPLTVMDLPIVDMPSTGMAKCFVDVVMDIPTCPIPKITKALQDKSTAALPAPFGHARSSEAAKHLSGSTSLS